MIREEQTSNYLGKNLRFLRDVFSTSQDKVAWQLHMSRSCYSAIESGKRPATLQELMKISSLTKVSIDQLLRVDLKAEILSGILYAELSSDTNRFIEEYCKLSAKGRGLIASQIKRLLSQEGSYASPSQLPGVSL